MAASPPRPPDAGLSALAAAAEGARIARRGPAPVHLWNPPVCGVIDIRIARDGTWFHEGSPIGRTALVELFSTVLRKDPDGYWLVTPSEKLKITVEDAPFVAVRLDRDGDGLTFTTNVGDRVEAGPDHPLRIETDPGTGEPSPYLLVRGALEARLTRSVFYELVDLAEARTASGRPELGVRSRGVWFRLGAGEDSGAG